MTSDQLASLLYLSLLGAVIAGTFLVSNRRGLGRGLRHGSIWALIFIGVVAGYGLWSDIQRSILPSQAVFAEEGRIEVPRGPDGHYHLTLEINGTPVRFVVDTGASDIVLTLEDAERVGFDPSELAFVGAAATANGRVSTAPVRLDEVRLGPILDTGVRAVVNGGEMPGSLLGMAYLDRFAEMRFGDGRMTLSR